MFILTCPSCQHRLRVKFARVGATAICPSCKAKFTVDQKSLMAVQEPTSAAAQSGAGMKLSPQPAPGGRPTPPSARPAQPATRATQPTQQPRPRPAQVAEPRPAPAADPHDDLAAVASAVARRPVKKKKSGGLSVKLVAVLLILCVTLGTVAFLLVYSLKTGFTPSQRVIVTDKHGNPVDLSKLKGAPDTAPSTGMSGAANDPATFVHQSPTAAAPAKPPAPSVALESLPFTASQWTAINPPAAPLNSLAANDAMLWSPRVEKDPDSGAAVFSVTYLNDLEKVYEQGFVHAQLVDAGGKAIAEFKQAVPALATRAGVQIRVSIPKEMAAQAVSAVADITPIDALDQAVPVQLDEASVEMVGGSSGAPVLELGVYNPHTVAVTDAVVIVEVLSDDGGVLGVYRGRVSGRIEPNKASVIRITPQLPANAQPGRLTLRGFAMKAP